MSSSAEPAAEVLIDLTERTGWASGGHSHPAESVVAYTAPSASGHDSVSRLPGLSVVVPAYNERDRISRTLQRYLPVLESCGVPFEVLVVTDGTDDTHSIASQFAPRGVRIVRARHKLGKGGAILLGFRSTRYDVVGYVDADGSLSASDLAVVIGKFSDERTDCVIASRWSAGSRWIRRESFAKRVASRAFNFLVRGLLFLPLSDTQCGAKFYRGAVVDSLLPKVTVTNLTTDVGFLFHAHRSGARVMEVPVTWDDDPRSRYRLRSMIPIMFLTVIGIRVMNLPVGRLVPDALVSKVQGLIGSV